MCSLLVSAKNMLAIVKNQVGKGSMLVGLPYESSQRHPRPLFEEMLADTIGASR